jgi:hypothetical protein
MKDFDIKTVETDGLLDKLEAGKERLDLGKLAAFFATQTRLFSALEIRNIDPTGHLLGTHIDYAGNTAQLRIPPGGAQVIENFSFLTMWYIRLHKDPPVRLTNKANGACFYEVNKLLPSGQNIQQQFINPHQGASVVYDLDVGDRLIVVPLSMGQYMLRHGNHINWAPPQDDPLMQGRE